MTITNPAVGGCYFTRLPGLQLSTQPQSTTTIWPVSVITAE